MPAPQHDNKALWGGRFEGHPEHFTQEFGASLPVDNRLWREDIDGSKAHARMLARQGIISNQDAEDIVAGLDRVAASIEAGTFVWDIDDEDIHMAIERTLTEDIGAAGGRLHTGRSRNDQVATDTRLWAKRASAKLAGELLALRQSLIDVAADNPDAVMPGYTHMQRAQPILFAHHMLAYSWMFARDFTRVAAAHASADVLPLGSAALAGTTYPLDRSYVAEQLGFSHISQNSLDAVSDRDFLLDLDYACSVAMMHLSRLAEELVYWSSGEFGFITMSDQFSTGSSIMPQKKNPDFAELIRGKSGRVVGDLTALLVTMKGLPLAYNKDMQEDKEGVFDAVDTLTACLHVMRGMITTMRVNEARMREAAHGGFMAATDLADYLVGTGLPFREAHEVVGRIVLACEKEGRTLQSLTLEELKGFSDRFGEDARDAVDIDRVVDRRTTVGGTSHSSVAEQLASAREQLASDKETASRL